MSKLEKLISEVKKDGDEVKLTKAKVPSLNKEVDFVLRVYNGEIDEYLWVSETLEEMEEVELWVQEFGGAKIIAKSVGMIDTQWTF
jgi:hypothetical protein